MGANLNIVTWAVNIELLQQRHQLSIYWSRTVKHKLGHAVNRHEHWWNLQNYYQLLAENLQKKHVLLKKTSITLRQKSYEEKTIINTLENTESSKSLAYINNSNNNEDNNNDQS